MDLTSPHMLSFAVIVLFFLIYYYLHMRYVPGYKKYQRSFSVNKTQSRWLLLFILLFILGGLSIPYLPLSHQSHLALNILWVILLLFFAKYLKQTRLAQSGLKPEEIKQIEQDNNRFRLIWVLGLLIIFVCLYFLFNTDNPILDYMKLHLH